MAPPECTIEGSRTEGLGDGPDGFALVISYLSKAVEGDLFRTVPYSLIDGRYKCFFDRVIWSNTATIDIEDTPFTPVLGRHGDLAQVSRILVFRLHDPWRRRLEAEPVRGSAKAGHNWHLPEECFHRRYFTPQWSPRSRILITLSVSGSLLPLVPATFKILG